MLDDDEVAWRQTRIQGSVMGSSKKMAQLNTKIQLLKTLSHKNIQKLLASWIDEDNKTVNIITELCTSGTLRQLCITLFFLSFFTTTHWERSFVILCLILFHWINTYILIFERNLKPSGSVRSTRKWVWRLWDDRQYRYWQGWNISTVRTHRLYIGT